METCEICGETKNRQAFIKIKHWEKKHDKNVKWCRDCQRMYINMKEFEKAKEELTKKLTGLIEFK